MIYLTTTDFAAEGSVIAFMIFFFLLLANYIGERDHKSYLARMVDKPIKKVKETIFPAKWGRDKVYQYQHLESVCLPIIQANQMEKLAMGDTAILYNDYLKMQAEIVQHRNKESEEKDLRESFIKPRDPKKDDW